MQFRKLIAVISICFFILPAAFFVPNRVLAQELNPQQRAQLEAELAQTQREIEEQEKIIADLKQKQKTIGGDISILTAQIKQAEAVLAQKNTTIKKLTTEINTKVQKINTLAARIDQGKASVAELLRKTREIDQFSLPEAVLSDKNFTEFFGDLDTFSSIQRNMQTLLDSINVAKTETEKEKQALDEKKNQELDAKYVIELKKKEVTKNETEKKQLLAVVNKNKAEQDAVLAQKQARAEQIRIALFGLRDAEAIPFATALEYANNASRVTGVRAALILAILTQESELGKNIGSCFVKSLDTGDGVGKNTATFFQQVMKAPRDTVPFGQITASVGRDWSTSPVSCPLGTVYTSSRGYGGAMGPSQFIPSTWELFKPRIASAAGVSVPNPWNAQHAIIATALYLQDLGASLGTYTSERNAACRYYSGRSCDSRRPSNSFYGTSVLQKAETIQANIDFLKSV